MQRIKRRESRPPTFLIFAITEHGILRYVLNGVFTNATRYACLSASNNDLHSDVFTSAW